MTCGVAHLLGWAVAALSPPSISRSSGLVAFLGRRLRTVLDLSRSAVVITDPEGRVVVWNHAAERRWGLPRPAVLGQDVAAVTARLCEEVVGELEHDLRGALSVLQGSALTILRAQQRLSDEQRAMLAASLTEQVARIQEILEGASRAPESGGLTES